MAVTKRIEAKLDTALQELLAEVEESCRGGLRLEDTEDSEVIEVSAGLLCAVKTAHEDWGQGIRERGKQRCSQ